MPSDASGQRIGLIMICAAALRAAVSGARTITWWRVGYWVVGSLWLNRESKGGFTTARRHTRMTAASMDCRPSRIPRR